MSILTSAISQSGAAYEANKSAWEGLVTELLNAHQQNAHQKRHIGEIELGEAQNFVNPHLKDNPHLEDKRLLPRDRVLALLDEGSPFLELSPLAANGLYGFELHGAGLIAGIGRVSGRETMILCNDATIKGGAYFPMTVKKHLRAQEVAMENHLPSIYLIDSMGLDVAHQGEVFADKNHFGRILYNQARMSAMGFSQIAVIMGACKGEAAYLPAMADETIVVKAEGGAKIEEYHSSLSDHIAQNDNHALQITRRIIAKLHHEKAQSVKFRPPQEPLFSPNELEAIVPVDLQQSYDVREVIARLVDGSEFEEFKPHLGHALVTGFANLHGCPIGIVANNGDLTSQGALKGAHFIELCCQRKIPLIFLQNITANVQNGEDGGDEIAKDNAKLLMAVACAEVPKITLIIGGSYGVGNYGICGRSLSPRFLFMWPNARLSLMAADQAASSLAGDKRRQLEALGEAWSEVEEGEFKVPIIENIEGEGSPYFSTARLFDDGIIRPSDSRRILSLALSVSLNAPILESKFGVFRM